MIADLPHPGGRYRARCGADPVPAPELKRYRVELRAVVEIAAASPVEAVEAVSSRTLLASGLHFTEQVVKVKEEGA
jgi:hypothetical protein